VHPHAIMIRPGAKALNKPLLIVGIDRKLAGLAFLLSVIVGANDDGSKIAAVVLFIALCALGRRLTRKDPNIFLVLNQVRKQKALYDSAKRERLRLFVERRTKW
jgi:type IV secretory pathway TrbD component